MIIDTERGNFLKIDRHKYVRVAYHGIEQIDSTTRKVLYSKNFNKVESFSEKSYVNMDTLFQFVDAHLFALLIDLKDHGEYEFLDFKTYSEIYRHIRESVDLCHRDGVIKDEVARNPEKYIVLDNGMMPMLKRYKKETLGSDVWAPASIRSLPNCARAALASAVQEGFSRVALPHQWLLSLNPLLGKASGCRTICKTPTRLI